MKEILIVILSAVVGYVCYRLSPLQIAQKRQLDDIIKQPQINSEQEREIELTRLAQDREQKLQSFKIRKI